MSTLVFNKKEEELSKDVARERLKTVLLSDRNLLSPTVMELIRADLLRTLTDYVEVETPGMTMDLARGEAFGEAVLRIAVPIVKVKSVGIGP